MKKILCIIMAVLSLWATLFFLEKGGSEAMSMGNAILMALTCIGAFGFFCWQSGLWRNDYE